MYGIQKIMEVLGKVPDYENFETFILKKYLGKDNYKIIFPKTEVFIKDIKKEEYKNNELGDILFYIFGISKIIYPNGKLFQEKEVELIQGKNNAIYLKKDEENIYIAKNIDKEIGILEEKDNKKIYINKIFYIINIELIKTRKFQNLLKLASLIKRKNINVFDKKYKDNQVILFFLYLIFYFNNN